MKDWLLIDNLLLDHIVLMHNVVVALHLIISFGWMEMEANQKNERQEGRNVNHPSVSLVGSFYLSYVSNWNKVKVSLLSEKFSGDSILTTGVELDTSFWEVYFLGPNFILLLQKYVFWYFLRKILEIKSI